jgi:hypothetical protein
LCASGSVRDSVRAQGQPKLPPLFKNDLGGGPGNFLCSPVVPNAKLDCVKSSEAVDTRNVIRVDVMVRRRKHVNESRLHWNMGIGKERTADEYTWMESVDRLAQVLIHPAI